MKKKPFDVISFGELLWDVLPTGAVLGGAPANFALRLSALGDNTALVSQVGDDSLGSEAKDILSSLGLSVDFIQTDPIAKTGTVDVVIDSAGNASYEINTDVAYDKIVYDQSLLPILETVKVIAFGTLIQRGRVSRDSLYRLIEAGHSCSRLADINLRKDCFSVETVRRTLELSDIIKLNGDEVLTVCDLLSLPVMDSEAFAQWLIDEYEVTCCLITRGASGVFASHSDGTKVDLPGYEVKIADTIGAGDAFTAGFVHKFIHDASLEECCDFGNRYGALVATIKGGMGECNLELLNSDASITCSM